MVTFSSTTTFTTFAVMALVAGEAAAANNFPNAKNFTYEVVSGFFIQDTSPSAPAVPPSFGLVDTSATRWHDFQSKITDLNAKADKGVTYKVLFLGRHGQGWHNVAESFYGTPAWDETWSKLTSDGNMTWGPDAKLTPTGIDQALAVNQAWKAEVPQGIPLPQTLYSSPMSRAASTLNLTFSDVLPHMRPWIKEGLREIYGVHTCDERDTCEYLRATYPKFNIEPGFTEKDELWTPDHRETNDEADIRLRKILDYVFKFDRGTYLSFTAHSGAIGAILRVLGHGAFSLATGGVIPVVVKATVAA